MRTQLVWPTLVALSFVACGGGSNDNVTTNNGNRNNVNNANNVGNNSNANNTQNNVTNNIVDAEFGLDARPANPNCVAKPRPPSTADVTVDRVFPDLTFSQLVWAQQRGDDGSKWYVVEKAGRVRVFENREDVSSSTVFVDISGRVENDGEAGLLGMAFHPSRDELYLSYNARPGGQLVTRISRFSIDGDAADSNTEEVLMQFDQPFGNHNGGQISFGPDGYLYFGSGDGGSGGDPLGSGQNTNTVLGAMLRIDVDSTTGNLAYGIPSDNPFADGGGAAEIYAWGLRNPWRWSFDRETGDLWVADVGQRTVEEVNIVELGGNYGWAQKEGTRCFDAPAPCDDLPFIEPIVEYGRTLGRSITGGYVYRGTEIPGLVGSFIYGDFETGRVWGIAYDERTGEPFGNELAQTGLPIASFAQDVAGEVYVLDFSGRMFRINANTEPPASEFPELLSQTGCVDPSDVTRPAAGLIPYDLNAPFWSDDALKSRYMAIPDGEQVTVDASGDFRFPVGTVLVKNFDFGGRRIETRLFMRHEDGDWAGYSYAWNDSQTDATLLRSGTTRDVGGGKQWLYPSRSDCLRCHTEVAGRALGPEIAQLNRSYVYESTERRSNQIATLEHIGVIAEQGDDLPALQDPLGDGPISARARAYLHSNCSSCHRDGDALRTEFDFSFTADVSSFCDVSVIENFGNDSMRVIAPGSPENSAAWFRASTRDANGMPPVGSLQMDTVGTMLLNDYITQLRCP